MRTTKIVSYAATFAVIALAVAGTALAAPSGKGHSNPNVVANYTSGDHGVVGEYFLHTGADLVMASGNSGNFQQWFTGTTSESGDAVITEHSVWKISKNGSCPSGWILVADASSNWGSYLTAGADYCVKTN